MGMLYCKDKFEEEINHASMFKFYNALGKVEIERKEEIEKIDDPHYELMKLSSF